MKKLLRRLIIAKGIITISVITALLGYSIPSISQAAALTSMSDTMTRLKIDATADHTVSWTLPSGVTFAAGDKARVDFPSAFGTAGTWLTTEFTFIIEGAEKEVIAVGDNIDPICTAGPNNVAVKIIPAADQFEIWACPTYTESGPAAAVIFTIAGISPDGILTNPSIAGNYMVSLVGDDKGNGFGGDDDLGSFPLTIITNDQVTVTAHVPSTELPPPGTGAPPSVETKVIFSGRAYPKSAITLLKDAQISATTVAGSDANFQISISNLSAGDYIFSLYSEDYQGVRSSLLTFSVRVTSGVTTNVSGIFIAPTIATDKSEVKRGEDILFFGQSAPKADIKIFIKSKEKEFSANTIADNEGKYKHSLNTVSLNFEQYQATVIATVDNLSSNLSRIIYFIVGTKTVFEDPLPEYPALGDFNNDYLVNLIDFSVLIYWFDRPNPPARVDLNRDGRVDLVDFSIMIYYWTG